MLFPLIDFHESWEGEPVERIGGQIRQSVSRAGYEVLGLGRMWFDPTPLRCGGVSSER
jgi:hypothetical protein